MKALLLFLILSSCHRGLSAELERWQLPLPQNEKLNVVTKKLNAKSANQKFPVLLLLGGLERGESVVEMVTTSEPLMVVSVEYPYREQKNLSLLDKIKEVPKIKSSIHLTLNGILALLENLAQRSDVDPHRISIVGGSFGSPFAIVVAERSPHISGLIVLHGFADIASPLQKVLEKAWSSNWKILTTPLAYLTARLATIYLNFPDPRTSIEHLRPDQKVLMVTAMNDAFIPADVTESMWSALQSSQARTFRRDTQSNHVIGVGSPELKSLTAFSIQWMKENRLL